MDIYWSFSRTTDRSSLSSQASGKDVLYNILGLIVPGERFTRGRAPDS